MLSCAYDKSCHPKLAQLLKSERSVEVPDRIATGSRTHNVRFRGLGKRRSRGQSAREYV